MNATPPFIIVNVDDNDMNLLLIQTYLNSLDAQFVNFSDSLNALEYIRNNRCDMLIVDYKMPGMDGIELTRQIKRIDAEIPVIMITASTSEEAVQIKALEAGVNDFIIKPINKIILLNRTKNFMKMRKAILHLMNEEKFLQEQIDQATENLQKHISDLQTAQRITHLGSWTWDIMTGKLHWSEETYRIFNLEAGSFEPTYEIFLDFVHPNDRLLIQQAVDYAVFHNTPYNFRHRIIVNGTIKYVHERGSVTYNAKREPVQMIGTIYDITEVTEAYLALEQKEHETLNVLSKTAEFKDVETSKHVKRVSEYAVLMARQIGLSNKEQEILRYAAPLHDIGKVGTPDRILLKHGKLSHEEMELMREHTSIGGQILQDAKSPFLQAGYVIALSHHEKFDGTGYPNGLKGEEIPLYGRIVAIADVFDALTSNRPYKNAWDFNEAMHYIKENAGSHFDPELVRVFVRHRDEIYTIFTQNEDES